MRWLHTRDNYRSTRCRRWLIVGFRESSFLLGFRQPRKVRASRNWRCFFANPAVSCRVWAIYECRDRAPRLLCFGRARGTWCRRRQWDMKTVEPACLDGAWAFRNKQRTCRLWPAWECNLRWLFLFRVRELPSALAPSCRHDSRSWCPSRRCRTNTFRRWVANFCDVRPRTDRRKLHRPRRWP